VREDEPRFGLARALSKAGYCSRSRASELIRKGRVRLNGSVRRDPETPVRLSTDHIHVDGHPLTLANKLYYVLNKPRGVVTTASDEKGRATIYQHLPDNLPWLSPVGRLDKASEGLLLLTNDSEWAARILAPETHLAKTYHVQVNIVPDSDLQRRLQRGVKTPEGDLLRARLATLIRSGEKNSWIEITLDEGRNRHIRRMLAALNIEVLRLIRIAIGPLHLGELRKGECRALTPDEKEALDRAMQESAKPISSRS
jgi:23S rRNA pseudouridine2605 synthase